MPNLETASGLDRWWEQHSELDHLIRCLVESLDGAEAAAGALQDLERALDAHFRLEEEVYFPLVEGISAELRDAVAGAREGHRQLRADLDALRGRLAAGDGDGARARLKTLLQRFHRHEEAEAGLVSALDRHSGV